MGNICRQFPFCPEPRFEHNISTSNCSKIILDCFLMSLARVLHQNGANRAVSRAPISYPSAALRG